MPLQTPTLDTRRYQQILDEALARIPVYTPEYTNFNKSDPGVTLIEVFAFMTENLLYRSSLIPERNRRAFLNLLGLPLQPGAPARGMVAFTNERGPLRTITLNGDLEARAGQVPFRTEAGLDVLPVEVQVFYKHKVSVSDPGMQEYYRQLYASYVGAQPLATTAAIYETRPLPPGGVDLGVDAVDGSLWLALLVRAGDKPFNNDQKKKVREQIGGRVLSLGLVPIPPEASRRLAPIGQEQRASGALLRYQAPRLPTGGALPLEPSQRVPRYQDLPAVATADLLAEPGVAQITLPGASELELWSNLDPLEDGVGDFPPSLEDTSFGERLITWLRVQAPTSGARFLWAGANAAMVTQRTRVSGELLPPGSGEPDQAAQLAHAPVISATLRLTVTAESGQAEWRLVDDLFVAGAEVPVPDPRLPPGTPPPPRGDPRAYVLDAESGVVRFGDGAHGARPPFGATLRADYDYSQGAAGNVGAGAISAAPALPSGIKVSNPVPTWGGAAPEGVRDGERQITRYLQHQDRMVALADFEAITYRTPGVEVGRVEVLPAFSPAIAGGEPGDAPGAVTLMLIPRNDPAHPDAPVPDRLFLDAVCAHLEPRRLVTTEIFLRAPVYRPVWVSIGITVAPRASIAEVSEAVKAAVRQFLSPLPPPGTSPLDEQTPPLGTPPPPGAERGWPLRKPVMRLELLAVANRVPGVQLVNDTYLVDAVGNRQESLAMRGLELPYLAGIAVVDGPPLDPSQLPGLGAGTTAGPASSPAVVPVPFIPEECR